MKKQYCFIAAMMLGFFSSASSAATQSFYAYGSNDNAMNPTFLSQGSTKNFSINYSLSMGSNLTITSAALWLRAVDDYNGGHCSGTTCIDSNSWGRDPSEKALVTTIENNTNQTGFNSPLEINNFGWYELKFNNNIDLTKILLTNIGNDSKFTATIKASLGDFWYKNAKLVVNYDLKPIPVPAAIWLFGPALLGLTGMRRKTVIKNMAG